MSLIEYHKSVGLELTNTKNRVRDLLGAEFHKYSDGKHKESILRSVLGRHLPKAISAKNGFIRINDELVSSEIDIVLFHNDRPLLFQNEDLVVTTPITIFGGIEVKTKLRTNEVEQAFTKLANNAESTRSAFSANYLNPTEYFANSKKALPWFSLFSFESEAPERKVLELLNSVANKDRKRIIECVCLGPNKFIRFWSEKKDEPYSVESFTGWRLYDLPELSFSYFISNMIWQDQVNSNESNPWFPLDDKETRCIDQIEFTLR